MKRLWLLFAMVLIVSFAILSWIGTRIYQEMPPIAEKVVTPDGAVIIDNGEIQAGQNVWQTLGGMELGSIWGHGSYVAPDWTADWLHREAVFILNRWAKNDFGSEFEKLNPEKQAQLSGRLAALLRKNTYDAVTRTITIDSLRAEAFQNNVAHYSDTFANGNADYAIPPRTVTDEHRLRRLSAFIFWTAWAAVTNRPDDNISYTNNWPYEPLVGNRPTGEAVVWTGVSIIMLLAGISAMAWWYAARRSEEEVPAAPEADPLRSWAATPSQKATIKYFWVVAALILVQMLLGVVTAHYGVEGDGFYGIPLS
jgi:nitric oxide reductase subunit B